MDARVVFDCAPRCLCAGCVEADHQVGAGEDQLEPLQQASNGGRW